MNEEGAEHYSVQIWRATDNRILKREWRNKNGELHNPDGPAVEVWNEATGQKEYEQYYENGVKHRVSNPAYTEWDVATGNKVAEVWWQNDEIHRDGDFPASTSTDPVSGVVVETSFFRMGELHRENGPAIIERNIDGSSEEVWCHHGDTHRIDGLPAIIKRDKEGVIVFQEFWENNVEVSIPENAGKLDFPTLES